MTVVLRDYQDECLKSILNGVRNGVRLQVITLATGLGKTVIFAQLPKIVKEKSSKKTLVLAHRGELLEQAYEKIKAVSPDHVTLGIEKAEQTAEPDDDVIIASVATLGRFGSERIKKFNPEHFGLIIIDEAHHAVADSYKRILSYFGANKEDKATFKPNHPVVLGVTATPNRKDNQGLGTLFDKQMFKYDIKDGIDNGYLADIEAFTIFTNEELNVKVQAGDFQVGALSEAVNTPHRNALVVETYKLKADGEKALFFAVDVQHSQDLAQAFTEAGYKADWVAGETPSDERKEKLDAFKNGDLQVMVNCQVLTEGYDNPNIKVVGFARPTTSTGLYIQMAGRGTRLAPGKETVKFLDFVDNCKKHSIVSASTLIGLDQPIKAKGERIMALKEQYEELLANHPAADLKTIDVEDLQKRIEEVDIFKQAQLPNIVQTASKYAWHSYLEGFKMSLGTDQETGDKLVAEIREDVLGQHVIRFIRLRGVTPSFKNGFKKYEKIIMKELQAGDQMDALQVADTYIYHNYSDKLALVNQNAGWRKEKPTEKQIALLQKFKIATGAQAALLTKGEASNLLQRFFDGKKSRTKL